MTGELIFPALPYIYIYIYIYIYLSIYLFIFNITMAASSPTQVGISQDLLFIFQTMVLPSHLQVQADGHVLTP